jgi:hypothetical protein
MVLEVIDMAELKERLIQDLRRLPPEDLTAVQDFVRVLLADPEALTSEEAAEVEAGQAEIARGEFVRWEDVRRTKCSSSD